MESNAKKAKRSYLSKLKKMVASHTYDLGKQVLDEGIENAKELHDVDLPVNKRMKDIVKEVVEVNTKVKNYIKATKEEVAEVVKEGTKQAIVAIKNDKQNMTTEEDEFLASLDIDLDDFDEDDLIGDDSDDMDIAEESMSGREMWRAASEYTSMRYPVTVAKLTNDDISAAILLLLQKAPCPEFQEIYSTHADDINNVVKTGTHNSVAEIKEGSGDKLNYVKNMIQDVNADMVPNVGTEDIDEEEVGAVGIVVEVIPTELPTVVPTEELNLKARIHRVIHMYLDKLEGCISRDEEITGMLAIAEAKISAVATYVSTLCGKSNIEIENMIMSSIEGIAPSCIPVCRRLALAFYLGIIPEDLIEQGRRIISIYYNKICKD